jgi:hypothetical protein
MPDLKDDRRCVATSKGSGERCVKASIVGGTVCSVHGGSAPAVRAAAGRRVAEADARKAVATYGLAVDIDPSAALLQEIARTQGAVLWLADKVRELDPEALVWGITKTQHGHGQQGRIDVTEEAAEVSAWVRLWQTERSHLVKVCESALRAGVAERQVRLAEQQGELIAAVIRAVFDDEELGLDSARRAIAGRLTHRHLLAIGSQMGA